MQAPLKPGKVWLVGVGPGSPCTSWPAAVGTDVFGQAVVETIGGIVKCRCPSP